MGLYDRDYGRASEQTPWDRLQNPRSMTITLIIINVAIFFVDYISARRTETGLQSILAEWFAVSGTTLTEPWKIWQVLTYGFIHSVEDWKHILFNMFGLFIFGRNIEQKLGSKEFLRFYLVSIVFGGLVAAIFAALGTNTLTIGASGGVVAVTILFACYFPNVELLLMMVVPVKAWILAVGYVAFDLAGALGITAGQSNTAFVVHIAGAGFALLYFYQHWNLSFLAFGGGISGVKDQLQARSRRMKLKLHDPDRKIAKEADEADRILAKIHESGEASLTSSERKILERYSRRQRERRDR